MEVPQTFKKSKKSTSVICPLSALMVLSMFALKFHLRIDIKELSITNSKSGKDLCKNFISAINRLTINNANRMCYHDHEGKNKFPTKITAFEWCANKQNNIVESKLYCQFFHKDEILHSPDLNFSSLKKQQQSTHFLIFLKRRGPTATIFMFHFLNGFIISLIESNLQITNKQNNWR